MKLNCCITRTNKEVGDDEIQKNFRRSFDREYVEKLAARDAETEKDFIAYFGMLITIKVRANAGYSEMVEDVRQETFLRVLKALQKVGGLREPERIGAFVNSVCNHVILELFWRGRRSPGCSEYATEQIDENADPMQELVTEERKQTVANVLSELSERDRELLRQIYLEERDKDLVCREMNVSRQYLRVLTFRARRKFETALAGRSPAVQPKRQSDDGPKQHSHFGEILPRCAKYALAPVGSEARSSQA